jgi:dCMP deaminase
MDTDNHDLVRARIHKTTRLSKDETFVRMAIILSKRSTCLRRNVGCILVDKYNHIIGSGYNGNASGLIHCIDIACPGATLPSGEGLNICEAIHAEQNALMQCIDVQAITTIYTTSFPCMHCLKMLLNTSCKHIVYYHRYADFLQTSVLWERSGRTYAEVYLNSFRAPG